MEQNLQTVLDLINADANLSEDEKALIIARLNAADKKMGVDAFRIERGEHLKKTMSVLLDETIEELEQKRKAVEEKNRDLEIEAALERVRTVAMGMRAADDLLNICKILFEELTALEFAELRNAMINIVNDEKGSFLCYDFNGDRTSVTPFQYNSHPVIDRQIDITRSASDAFIEHILTGDDLQDFKAFRVTNGEPPDPKLENINALYYYFYSIGDGSVGISSFSSLPEEKLNVLKRFRNVFDLAYRRYADIQLAAAQAREAQIELALERVRARTMAMQRSEELAETAYILFQQFKELGENPDQATIGIINEEEHVIEYWVTMYGSQINKVFKFSIDEPNVTHKIYKGWKAKKKSLVIDLSGQELYDFTTYRSSMGGAGFNPAEKRRVINVAFFSKGIINVQSNEERSAESIRLLERFAGVFDSTYTRFLDLKKAEAQVREAQIEAALERTRTQSMIMQHSSELDDTLRVFHQQVLHLGINSAFSFLWLPDEEKDRHIFWAAWAENNSNDFRSKAIDYPLDRNEPATAQCLIDWKGKDPVVSYHVPPEGVAGYFATWQELIAGVEQLKPEYFKGGLYYVEAFMKYGCFGVIVESSLSPEETKILGRFAIEFERTYTRFLDLQKAESQARESQIELALERVRARTMAMQKSEELKEIIKVVYEQLVHLNILAEHAGFIMDYKASNDMKIWLADKHFDPSYITIPYFDSPHWNSFVEAKKKGTDFFVNLLSFEEKNKFYRDLFALVPGVTDEAREFYMTCPGLAGSTVLLDNVGLYIENFSGIPYTDEENSTLMRFGKVFQQTYTRFLDLQKAEAQAREAQIEAALEKVRSSSLAMHKSDELRDIVKVVFEKLQDLGFAIDGAAFIATPIENSRDLNIWIGDDHAEYPSCFRTPFYDSPVCLDIWAAMESGSDFFSATYSFEEKTPWFNYIFEHSDYKHLPGELKGWILEQETLTQCFAWTKNSAIGIHFHNRRALYDNEIDILKRFAKVFDQAYIRFLDLQKAEAQAREAQIELSLERVRASAMAMHKTDQLLDAAELLYRELTGLGIKSMAITYAIMAGDEKTAAYYSINPVDGKLNPVPFDLSHTETEVMRSILSSWKKRETVSKLVLDEEATLKHQTYIAGIVQAHFAENNFDQPFSVEAFLEISPKKAVIYAFNFAQGYIFIIGSEHLTKPQEEMVMRFTKVFEMTYRRFLDLKKAEEQARESQIQLALERVRARTMAMQKSEELHEVIQLVFDQLQQLNFNIDVANFALNYKETDDFDLFLAVPNGKYPMEIHVPYFKHPVFDRFNKAKKKGNLLIDTLTKDEKDSFFEHFFKYVPGVSGETKASIFGRPGFVRSSVLMRTTALTIHNYDGIPYSEAENNTLLRFGQVFEQTYIRFKDLEQAEEQARESQIQLGLERVRAKAMAMQTSEELNELIGTVFSELTKLDFVLTRCLIMIFDPETKASRWWMANSEAPAEPMNYLVQNHKNPAYDAYLKAWKERNLRWNYALKGKVKRDWDDFLFVDTELAQLPAPVIAGMKAPEQVLLSASFNNFGCLTLVSLEPLLDEHSDIMLRFAKVFDMCYTRFNDLKQAEEQAKEAQIQLALERIRAKTMAMHNSVDVGDTVATMFDELIKLGIENTARCGIAIISDNQKMELWRASYNADGNVDRVIGRVDMTVHPLLEKVYRAWKNKETVCSVELTGKDQEDYFRALNDSPEYPVQFDLASLPPRQINSDFFFQEGCVYVFTVEPLSQEEIKLFKRFAGVFGLTYRRYLDLQKAEEQAREAKIEAALEKVRGKALAMYSSADLTSTASMVFTELRKLGINPIRCGVGMYNNGSRKVALYSATSSADGDSLGLVGWVMLEGHPVLGKIYESLVSGEDYFPVLKGKQLKSYYENLLSGLSLPALPDFHPGEEQYGHFFPFPDGCLYAWAERRYDETEIRILRRFAGVIDLTFRRYNELQKSEASAREAVRAASLDRVRAEIASMRSTEDLDRITPLVWNELTTLGIPFIRCGVFIIDEEEQLIHTHLSTANGKALATFNLPFDSQGISQNVLPAWREKQAATIHWSKEEFAEYTSNLVDEGTVKSQDKYVTEHPDTSLDLHFLPFLQGMLYVGNINPLTVDEMDLVQSLADAFSTAYARYEDFNKLEAAKEQVENTLTDLKAAQTKLIQSEKMASLGELTAGIAHEIQNPLNFVNNFSEVNQEMIDELADELKAGNIEEALAIAADIKDNEQKINHHGKRADGIVKGMLQHSRTGGGEKTQTNINALADEFMRLSYHGLRAKDKVFNAELVTHFDPNLPKISVIGQDIGRVLLNLFNNAFYAVNQKKKALNGDYKPEVTVTTSTENGQVVIKVKDNGTGIPDAIKEKIMQPFFTTKPTGEGTGLGLSLTYDMVVKGHGGSIQANSKEGEYCEFIISLPLS